MEPILFLLIAGIVLFLFIAPIILLFRTGNLSRSQDDLNARVAELESQVIRLQRELKAATRPQEEPAEATAVQAEEFVAPTPEPASTPSPKPAPASAQPFEAPPIIIQTLPRAETPKAPPPIPAPAPKPSVSPEVPPAPVFNWEQFIGVKLWAWVGGLAAFLAVAFFLKYSFEHNLIPPEVRAAVGFLTGLAMVVGGIKLSRKEYLVTSQTLCATGVVILYAVTFACRTIYEFKFFDVVTTFLLMTLITAAAFGLAVRLNAMVVAILGMLGGFLTPVLLSTGQDNPGALFGYIALLDLGLLAVVLNRRWNFLVLLAAVGTVFMQVGWAHRFFETEKVFTAMTIFLSFCGLFLGGYILAQWRKIADAWFAASALLAPAVTYGFAFYLLSIPELAARPGVLFTFVFVADLSVLALVLLKSELFIAQLIAGVATFLFLGVWTMHSLTNELLNWALGFYLLFAILHAGFPIVLRRLRPGLAPAWWANIFPPAALLLIMIPMFKLPTLSLLIWPCVLLIDLLAVGLALLLGSILAVVVVLLLTVLAAAVWIVNIPADLTGVPSSLLIVGGFAAFFFVAGIFACNKILAKLESEPVGTTPGTGLRITPEAAVQIPAMAALLPFILLIMMTVRLPLVNPSPMFGLALVLSLLVLWLAQKFQYDWLPLIGLGGVLALEHVWHFHRFQVANAPWSLGWYLLFYAVFAGFPFLFRKQFAERVLPWAASALSGPLHFYLVHRLVSEAYPNNFMGLLPAAFALPTCAGLIFLLRTVPASNPARRAQLAWMTGAALFFVTLIFPVQFERQWITLGWALEGAALLWAYQRVPHEGLRVTGVGLLLVAFARLALNPAVLSYHERSTTPILNWYLYAYLIGAACLFAGTWFLSPPRNQVLGVNVRPLLNTLGTVLLFLLVNIEIADYFSEGTTLTFSFSGNFARDMSYTIAWAVFAFALLLFGVFKQVRGARYASLGLLGVTLLKLFFHDLANLPQLYRVGALISVAIVAMLGSFIYQKFLAKVVKPTE